MRKYDFLNTMQKKAVQHTDGPLLILAGAGSGKTRVLTYRMSYLIEEKGISPFKILAITFTNKAAKEMRERVDDLIGYDAQNIWVSTFHSACVRILRRHSDKIGYDRSFTIYDTDDQKRLLKEIIKQLNLDSKQFSEKNVLSTISSAKDKLITPNQYKKEAYDFWQQKVADIYEVYQKKLLSNNALDFDDLIGKTVELFQQRPDVLEEYQDRFQYIMIDEYQDTNVAQYIFVKLLANKYRNLCVVGDDDQSIYRFRGANIQNILGFEKDFHDTTVVKLEQNYRSTKTILQAANEVIKNNYGRKSKTLWTSNEDGELIDLCSVDSEKEEAEVISNEIKNIISSNKRSFNEFAVLYRTNAQSRAIEERFIHHNIPYKLVGGVNFYQRKEIKDIIAYLKTINSPKDDLAVKRIINVPKRGIGTTTVQKIDDHAYNYDIDFFTALSDANHIPSLSRSNAKIEKFVNMIHTFKAKSEVLSLVELVKDVLDVTGYLQELKDEDTLEARGRIDNIDELITKVADYEENTDDPTLYGFLEEVSLVADVSTVEDVESVTLMTLHSAKGLEFPYVFLAGMEDGVFPSYMSISSGEEEDVEEERRLCYVGITRAKEKLYLLSAKTRMIRGNTQYNQQSRFLQEIPFFLLNTQQPLNNKKNISYNKKQPFSKKNNYLFNQKPYETKSIPVTQSASIDFTEGDIVKHLKYGIGEVIRIEPGGADYQVTVDFNKVGVKKLLASFAKLKKMD